MEAPLHLLLSLLYLYQIKKIVKSIARHPSHYRSSVHIFNYFYFTLFPSLPSTQKIDKTLSLLETGRYKKSQRTQTPHSFLQVS